MLLITTEGVITKIQTPNKDVWLFVEGEEKAFIDWYFEDYRKVNYG